MDGTSFPEPYELRGTVVGTILYLSLYGFVFIPYQSFSKIYLYKKKKNESLSSQPFIEDDSRTFGGGDVDGYGAMNDDGNNNRNTKNVVTASATGTAKDGKENGSTSETGVSSFRSIKYYNSNDVIALVGDRIVGNFVEQAIIFLPMIWIYAIFVNPKESWTIIVIYTITRAIHPIVLYMSLQYGSLAIFVSTIPGYVILLYLMIQIIWKFVLVA